MAYITRTTGTPTDRKKFTYSAWLKLANIETYQRPIQNYVDGNNRGYILYCHNTDSANNTWFFYDRIGAQINFQANSAGKYRDTNGFYHLVVRADTTQSTQADRYRVYINGEQISLSIATNIGQNVDLGFNNSGANLRIGGQESGSETWKGVMSHVHFCDGYSYAPTEFGSTDATTGEWKINTSPSVTYGNNGYFVFKDDNAVTDRSGQGNNFTLSGSITKTEDNPSNVFATLNPLHSGSITFSNGNLTQGNTSSTGQNALSTLGAVSGKFYAEVKCTAVGSNGTNVGFVNLSKSNLMNQSITPGQDNFSAGLYSNGGPIYYSSETTFATVGSTSNGDIIQLAMDLDNGYLYWGRNGTYLNSGVPTSGSTGTGGLATSNLGVGHIGFGMWQRNSATASWNFGNGFFGTTAVSSAGTNASNNGIFEYDVPAGYTALSTKGLNL